MSTINGKTVVALDQCVMIIESRPDFKVMVTIMQQNGEELFSFMAEK